jgi:hypothetical protein
MTKRAGASVFLVCLVLGCGGDDDGGGDGARTDAATGGDDARPRADSAPVGCAEAPSGTVTGTVDAVMIDPIAAAYMRPHETIADLYVLTINEDAASTCSHTDGVTGEALKFTFCDQPAIGEYEVVAPEDLPLEACPGERVVGAVVESNNGAERGVGDSGALTIESLDECLGASFVVGFDTGNLDGDVVASVCP